MNLKQGLKILKEDYLLTKPPASLENFGWQALKEELKGAKDERMNFFGSRVFLATLLAVVFLGFSFGVVQASQKALPGDALYPVKKLSEDLVVAISGDKHARVENRASEIIQAVENKKSQDIVKEAVKNYEKEVSKTKKEAEKSGEDKRFKQNLENQEHQFNSVLNKEGSSSNQDLQKAIEISKKGRSEDRQKEPEQNKEQEKRGKEDEK